jgi:16S rRNA (guanine966-N2)-methyltransferase
LRIISGIHKGRNITPPKNLPVRPTTDFAKESLFNILVNRIDFEEVTALDLFSGTGSIALELGSRGAKDIIAIESNAKCCEFIRNTAKALSLPVKVVKMDAMTFLKKPTGSFDFIFADPFYDFPEVTKIPDLVFGSALLKDDGILVVEHSVRIEFQKHQYFQEKRTYGNVNFSFFQRPSNAS